MEIGKRERRAPPNFDDDEPPLKSVRVTLGGAGAFSSPPRGAADAGTRRPRPRRRRRRRPVGRARRGDGAPGPLRLRGAPHRAPGGVRAPRRAPRGGRPADVAPGDRRLALRRRERGVADGAGEGVVRQEPGRRRAPLPRAALPAALVPERGALLVPGAPRRRGDPVEGGRRGVARGRAARRRLLRDRRRPALRGRAVPAVRVGLVQQDGGEVGLRLARRRLRRRPQQDEPRVHVPRPLRRPRRRRRLPPPRRRRHRRPGLRARAQSHQAVSARPRRAPRRAQGAGGAARPRRRLDRLDARQANPQDGAPPPARPRALARPTRPRPPPSPAPPPPLPFPLSPPSPPRLPRR